MATWITPTIASLRDTKASALIDNYQETALGEDQTDPVPRKINSICDRIRGEIQSSGKYQVSATPHSIPPSLFDLAGRLIAWDLRGRLNVIKGGFEPTEQDIIDNRNDLRYLERIAEGKVTIEVPDDPIATPETQSGGMIETVQEGNQGNSREELARL